MPNRPTPQAYLKGGWALPTEHENFRALAFLKLTLLNTSTSEAHELATLAVDHFYGSPETYHIYSFPEPDPGAPFKLQVRPVNRQGRIGEPAESDTIALGPVADAPGVTGFTVEVDYLDVMGEPSYVFVAAWTLPTGDPDYVAAFDKVWLEGKVGDDTNWIVFAKEGEGSTGVRTSPQPRAGIDQSWTFRAVPYNIAGERNEAAAATASGVVVLAAPEAQPVSGLALTRYRTYSADGTEQWGIEGTLDPQTIGQNYDGAAIIGQYYEGNQLLFPSELDNAYWAKGGLSGITPDAVTAPDGIDSADLLTEDTTPSIPHAVQRSVTGLPDGENFIVACHVKRPAVNGRHAALSLLCKDNTFAFARFNASTGATIVTSGPVLRTWGHPVGDDWFFIGLEANIAAGGTTPVASFWLSQESAHVYTGDGVSGLYLWHAFMARFDPHEHPFAVANGFFRTDSWPIANGPFTVWIRAYALNGRRQRIGTPEEYNLFVSPGTGQLDAGRLKEESLDVLAIVDGKLTVPDGSIVAAKIDSVNAAAITGSITAGQIGSVNAAAITGSISAGQIGSLDAGVIVAGSLDELTAFSSLLRPIAVVGSLPSLPNANYPDGAHVYLTTDGKLYRNVSGTWTKSIAATDITGTISAGQIGSVNAAAITGLISAAQIGSINGAVINVGTVGDSQIGSVSAGKLTAGTISASVSITSPTITSTVGSDISELRDGMIESRNTSNGWRFRAFGGFITLAISGSSRVEISPSLMTIRHSGGAPGVQISPGAVVVYNSSAVQQVAINDGAGVVIGSTVAIDLSRQADFTRLTLRGQWRTDQHGASGSPGAAATHKIPVYNTSGTLINYLYLYP